jgi:hypothetical protein
MKKADDLSNLSIEQLLEKKKKLKSMCIGIAIPMVIACLTLLYLAIKTKNYALIAVAMASSITMLPGFISIGAIDNEIKKRGQSKSSN